ncbi:MAG: hypothetical protein AABZ61_03865, partial [Bacteroidota bacterium]
ILNLKRKVTGTEHARLLLRKAKAEILIWGNVIRKEQASVPKLHWATSDDIRILKQHGRYPITSPELSLPELFRQDLAEVLRLLILIEWSGFASQEGRYVANRLLPYIHKVRTVLAGEKRGWSASTRLEVAFTLAGALSTYGEQSGDSEALIEAVGAYREALKEYTREKVPLQWAMTQNNLGAALQTLGERESGTGYLDQAVVAYREALKVFTPENASYYYEQSKQNLLQTERLLESRKTGRLDK